MKKQIIALCAFFCIAMLSTSASKASVSKPVSATSETAFIVKSFTCYAGGYEIHVSFNLGPQAFGPTAAAWVPDHSTYYLASVVAGVGDTWSGDGSWVDVSGLTLYISETDEYLFPVDGPYNFDVY